MYDIPELEKKWRKYKRNQIKKPILIGLGVFALVGVISFAGLKYLASSSSDSANSNSKSVENVTPVVKKEQPKNSSNNPAIVITKTPANQPTVQNNTPAPAQQNSAKVNSDETIDLSNATIVKPNVPDDEIRVIGFDNKEKKEITNKYKEILTPVQNTKPQIDPNILAYEERFKETQDPQDSLYLAKYYYKKGNYQKAETWAVNTNNIDGDIEDSWIIFAKARAKQGHRVDAIKVLQSYYDETNSAKAKEVLDKLRRNIPFK
jgi:predicted negative regulator of RcsB-dependent stress response